MVIKYIKLALFHLLIYLNLAFSSVSHADVFGVIDKNGGIHLTNVPSEPGYHIMLRGTDSMKKRRIPGSTVLGSKGKLFPYKEQVVKAARALDLDQALLCAIITVESGNNPKAVSSDGAVGLMQLMPGTAKYYGASNRYDPEENIQAGARYLHHLMQRFHGNLSLALAAYNAGEGAVANYGNHIPPYPETRRYIPRVLGLYQYYRAAFQ